MGTSSSVLLASTRRMVTPSASQRHLANVLSTLLAAKSLPPIVRVLEMGCGSAHMLAYFAQTFPLRFPNCKFEWYGFDVHDIGWHGETYKKQTIEYLGESVPEIEWKDRITTLSASSTWNYRSYQFDLIVSNQVLEHVRNHELVFSEIRRCLAPDGVSVHLFPLLETVYEPHAHMPVVHWIRRPDLRSKIMTLFAKLGFKRTYLEERHFRGWTNLDEFSATYSKVLETMTNYKTSKQILQLARAAGLRADYSYTKDFLVTKMLTLMGRTRQGYANPNWIDDVTFPVLKRVASVTLVLRT